jgi:hypothetical protein
MEFKAFKFKPVTIGGLKFKDVQYHRNGISGDGFHCAVAYDPEAEGDMLITYFDIENHCCCSAFKLSMLPNIRFAENSWRGDCYADRMEKAIEEYRKQFDKHYGLSEEKK